MGKSNGTSFPEDPFDIHMDPVADRLGTVEELEAGLLKPLYEVAQSDDGSELSDDSNCVVDVSVAEDMQKFEATFTGITSRFRLINRIGEGLLFQVLQYQFTSESSNHF